MSECVSLIQYIILLSSSILGGVGSDGSLLSERGGYFREFVKHYFPPNRQHLDIPSIYLFR